MTAQIGVQVTYGIGGSCTARFSRAEIEGLPALALVKRVIERPQAPGAPERTARVLAEVLRSTREIDAELADASSGEALGRPIALDGAVLRERGAGGGTRSDAPERDELTIRISESYRGGRPCPAGSARPSRG